MKDGATDPFADDETEDEQTTDSDQADTTGSITSQSDSNNRPTEADSAAKQSDQINRSDLPRILTRNSVKEDRNGGVHQLFLYQETADAEEEARHELRSRFDDKIYKLDAREAIYYAGMQNLDDAEDLLREWGADF